MVEASVGTWKPCVILTLSSNDKSQVGEASQWGSVTASREKKELFFLFNGEIMENFPEP